MPAHPKLHDVEQPPAEVLQLRSGLIQPLLCKWCATSPARLADLSVDTVLSALGESDTPRSA